MGTAHLRRGRTLESGSNALAFLDLMKNSFDFAAELFEVAVVGKDEVGACALLVQGELGGLAAGYLTGCPTAVCHRPALAHIGGHLDK